MALYQTLFKDAQDSSAERSNRSLSLSLSRKRTAWLRQRQAQRGRRNARGAAADYPARRNDAYSDTCRRGKIDHAQVRRPRGTCNHHARCEPARPFDEDESTAPEESDSPIFRTRYVAACWRCAALGTRRVAVGFGFSLAATENGGLWSWGDTMLGQLGLGDTEDRATPTPVRNFDGLFLTCIAANEFKAQRRRPLRLGFIVRRGCTRSKPPCWC